MITAPAFERGFLFNVLLDIGLDYTQHEYGGNRMKGLILYRSYYGNTKSIAETLAGEVKLAGHEVSVLELRQKLPNLGEMEFILIGAPTRIARVTRRALGVLKKIKNKAGQKTSVGIFDTCAQVPIDPKEAEEAKKWIFPGAAGIMHERAQKLGLNVYENAFRAEVTGLKGPLAPDAPEKAASFAREFIGWVGKKS
jgi:hypothetical protein